MTHAAAAREKLLKDDGYDQQKCLAKRDASIHKAVSSRVQHLLPFPSPVRPFDFSPFKDVVNATASVLSPQGTQTEMHVSGSA